MKISLYDIMIDKEIIVEYLKKERKFEGVLRELNIKIIPHKIISLLGPRRAGKTFYMIYLLNKYKDKEVLYLNFEEVFLKNISFKDLIEIIFLFKKIKGKEPSLLLLDEIQEIKDWESVLRSLIDREYNIVITGSSSKLSSKEIATQLRGRSLWYFLLPFSFREFIKYKDQSLLEKFPFLSLSEKLSILELLEEYIKYGGYPEVVISNQEEIKKKILKTYLDEIFLKDFIERHKIKSVDLSRFLFEFCFQNYSTKLSISKVESYLKSKVPLSKKTLYEYLSLIEDTLCIFFLERYSQKIYIRKNWPKKIYVVDLGLSHYFNFELSKERIMENLVFVELLRQQNNHPFYEYYFYETREGYEVDFLIKEGMKIKELMQVCYANSYEEIPEREIRALLHAKEELKLGDNVPLTVITWDYEDTREVEWRRKRGKIRFVPLWKWLLKG